MARTRRSPKKLRLAKSPRTARAAPRTPTRKPAGREIETARPALRTYDAATARQVGAAKKAWERGEVAKSLARAPERRTEFTTDSGIPLPAVVTPADRAREDARALGLPGQFPYTRGVQPTMYRGRLWTMRMFAGFGSPADTNQRFKYLMAHGTTGLSTAFDMPALMGYDADHSMSRGEVGKEGVAISTLRDFEILFDGIPLDQVTTSMTINASAIVALCMYIAVAEKQGVPMEKLGGTIQNDMLKEYIAQKEWIVPPRPAVRIVVDMIDFCSRKMPRWHPVSISGYHIREAGATAVQELAFTLADGIGYVEECVKRGMAVDDFAARLSFFWDVHNDFFEEIAKFAPPAASGPT
jgi:methylmalonyl-CoA mutase N-terminal domain/subunit